MDDIVKAFDPCWTRFKKRYKGKLYEKAQSQQLNFKKASAVLKKTQAVWEDEAHPCGTWLLSLNEKDAEKGAQVSQILTEKLSLTAAAETKKEFSKPAQILAPIVGALIGLAIAKAFGAGIFICIASFLSPLIVLVAVMKNISEIVQEKNTDSYILNYLEQLETYKDLVIEILKKEESI